MKIIINKKSFKENSTIIIDDVKKIVKYNNKEKPIKNSSLLEIFNFISSWEKSCIKNSIIDGCTYTIEIELNNIKETLIFKNKYPDNFGDFLEILKEIIDE